MASSIGVPAIEPHDEDRCCPPFPAMNRRATFKLRLWRSRGATPRSKPAQGNALGIRFQYIRGLKARPNRATIGADLRPLVCMRVRFLGRCPRLSWGRAAGAED